MAEIRRTLTHGLTLGVSLLALTACSEGIDLDFRSSGNGFDTSDAARQPIGTRPDPDDRGIITYPSFQVAIAKRGDTVADVAARAGLDADQLARYNGIEKHAVLRDGEVVALPGRLDGSAPGTGTGEIDITSLAGNALDRADTERVPSGSNGRPAPVQTGVEPIRHKVSRGETAYSISRLYRVSVRSLADWNGLGPDLTVREGQYLLIPVAGQPSGSREPAVTLPGEGSPTPEPPSARTALPEEEPVATTPLPPSPNLGQERTEASGTPRFAMPYDGAIIRGYERDASDGIDIAASAGQPVRAAGDGTIGAILKTTEGIQILVIRHANNLLTVYGNIDGITVAKGDKVSRGQTVAKVQPGSPSFVHFEVRNGPESVDPMPYLN
ncbi:MAG: peptidoglycan DD-metalloendopeptidase family protein [Rhodobacteraceae bacterium]|nr:peptidoglycan DD-metalloendopeptidase family protein [Paracoccaceae bacterium]